MRAFRAGSADQREPAGGGAGRRGEAGGDGAAGDAAAAGAGAVRAALRLLLRRGVVEHGAPADARGAAAAPRRRVPAAADAAQPAGPGVRRPPWPRPAAVVSPAQLA